MPASKKHCASLWLLLRCACSVFYRAVAQLVARPPEAEGRELPSYMTHSIVYVLINTHGDLYKGCTENLERRFAEHNSGQTISTKHRGPWKLIYTEEFENRKIALQRERFLKSGKGREALKTILHGL